MLDQSMVVLTDERFELDYIVGVVTKIVNQARDKSCLINNAYLYEPKSIKDIEEFNCLTINTHVKLSLYRVKNTNDIWMVGKLQLLTDISSHNQYAYVQLL